MIKNISNNITGIYNSSFYSNINLKSIIIPKTVKEMSQAVFEKCSNLESCVFEEGRTETLKYRWSLFMQCTSLKELIFPDDCIIDGNNNNMFDGCTSLKRVILPKNTTVLGSNFFRNCTSLEEVNLPATITSIGRSAFQGCAIKSIILPNIQNVILDGNVFYECKNLESITIPGGYDIGTLASSLFGYCEALVDATLEEGITVIAPNLFNRCIALKKVMLPSTVTTIGTSIFFNDYSMEILIVKSVTPPTVDGNDLGYNFSKQCKIYVPDLSVDIYKQDRWWSQYSSRIYPLSSYNE